MVSKVFFNKGRAQELLGVLRDMWVECNALRKAAVFIRQTFRDPISRADFCDAQNDHSKVARSLIPIDIVQAKGLKKHARLSKIEDIIYLFVEREAFKQQGLQAEV